MRESPRPRRPPLGTGDTEPSHVRPAGELAAQRWPILQVIGQDTEPHFPRRLSLSLDVQPGPGRRCRVGAGGSAGTLRQGRGHHERVGTSRPPGLGARAGAQAEVAPGTERPVARSGRLQPHRVSRRGQGSLRTPLLLSGKAREPPAPRSPALCSPEWTENPSSDLCFEKHPEQPKATNCLLSICAGHHSFFYTTLFSLTSRLHPSFVLGGVSPTYSVLARSSGHHSLRVYRYSVLLPDGPKFDHCIAVCNGSWKFR